MIKGSTGFHTFSTKRFHTGGMGEMQVPPPRKEGVWNLCIRHRTSHRGVPHVELINTDWWQPSPFTSAESKSETTTRGRHDPRH